MDWLKHSTGSHDDPDISDAIDEFGLSAYSTFFITLEVYGSEYNHLDSEGWLTISQRFLARKLRISSTKVQQILNFYSDRQRILIKISGNNISINCPKFIEISSNWTSRNLSKKLFQPTEGTTAPPTAKEEEKKKNRKEEEYNKDFLIFWSAYPKKSGSKKTAFDNWKKLNGSLPTIDIILNAIREQILWRSNSGDGEFRPEWKDPERWIKGKMWEPEFKSEEKSSVDSWVKSKRQLQEEDKDGSF